MGAIAHWWRDAATVVLIGVAFLVFHSQGVTEQQLRVSQLRSCHRLNILRAEDNRSQLVDYQLFTATVGLFARAVAHPEHPTTARQKAAARAYLARIRGDALAKEWVPLTACYDAVDRPGAYVIPVPVPFWRMLPPRSALYLGPGE